MTLAELVLTTPKEGVPPLTRAGLDRAARGGYVRVNEGRVRWLDKPLKPGDVVKVGAVEWTCPAGPEAPKP